ncbi:MAG: hypothetical protein KGS61_17505 [Verrucomicrobia bacterium]|nr:hypothetical protein [Verrucomicrobiota bacterium]
MRTVAARIGYGVEVVLLLVYILSWTTHVTAQSLSRGLLSGTWPRNYGFWRVTFGNGVFLAAGGGVTVISTDGSVWTWQDPGTHALRGFSSQLAAGAGRFVGIWNSASNSEAQVSSDGITWTDPVPVADGEIRGLTYANGQFVAVGKSGDGSGVVVISTDGQTWNLQDFLTSAALNAVTYGNGVYVAVGDSGVVMASRDALHWSVSNVVPGTNILAVSYGGGAFAGGWISALGPAGSITSTNGFSWNVHGNGMEIYRLAYGSGLFLALTRGVSVSTNGADWSYLVSFWLGDFNVVDIAYGAGVFVITGSYGPFDLFSPSYQLAGSEEVDGAMHLLVTGGGTGAHCRIQATSLSLSNWTDLFFFTNFGPTDFLDSAVSNCPQRFYRLVSP